MGKNVALKNAGWQGGTPDLPYRLCWPSCPVTGHSQQGRDVEWFWQVDTTSVPFWLDAGRLLDPLHGLILKLCHAPHLTFLIVSLQQVSLVLYMYELNRSRGLMREKMIVETCLAFLLLFFISLIPIGLKIAVYGRCWDRRWHTWHFYLNGHDRPCGFHSQTKGKVRKRPGAFRCHICRPLSPP